MTDAPRDEFLSDASQDANGTFSLEKFYTAATDKKGRSTTLNVHIPPSMLRAMQELVARRVVPEYRTTSDMVRDMLIVGLHMRLEQIDDPAFVSNAHKMETRAWAQSLVEMHQEDERMVDDMHKAFNGAKTPEERQAIRDRAEKTLDQITDPDQKERLRRLTW